MAIGYACITIGVADTQLSRCTVKNASEEKLKSIIKANLHALEKMIDYNIKNEISLYRISSDIIPFASHPVNQIKWWDEYQEDFDRIGQKIKSIGMRVSMHPGQYTVLNSNQPMVYKNAVKELEYHDTFLRALGMDERKKIILHIGGVYGDKQSAMQTFIDHYHKLKPCVKSRLVIENDDKVYNISEVLEISKETGAPVIFDYLHHEINPPKVKKSPYDWINLCGETWERKDGRQKLHYSLQKTGGLPGAHSDTIFIKPFLDFYEKLTDKNLDIMLEVKDKNLSAIKCMNMITFPTDNQKLKEEWIKYRYFILGRTAKFYQELKEKFMDEKSVTAGEFYNYIEQVFTLPIDTDAEFKAAKFIWGEIEDTSTNTERKRFEKLLTAYQNGTGALKPLKNHLLKCASNKGREYLEDSLYFYM